jgi:uncharacterized membrane protein YsdA (DUF1294 family)
MRKISIFLDPSNKMLIDNQSLYVLIFFLAVNLTAFLIMLADKIRSARPGAERISEGMLFFLAAAFGSVGVYAGMFAFRHKTRKWYFLAGIPLLMAENAAALYLAYLLLK